MVDEGLFQILIVYFNDHKILWRPYVQCEKHELDWDRGLLNMFGSKTYHKKRSQHERDHSSNDLVQDGLGLPLPNVTNFKRVPIPEVVLGQMFPVEKCERGERNHIPWWSESTLHYPLFLPSTRWSRSLLSPIDSAIEECEAIHMKTAILRVLMCEVGEGWCDRMSTVITTFLDHLLRKMPLPSLFTFQA